MTLDELIKDLRSIVKTHPEYKALPVQMFSDAEGNGLHDLDSVGYATESDEDHIDAVILVPGHRDLLNT